MLTACGTRAPEPSNTAPPTASLSPAPAVDPERIETGDGPIALAEGFGSVWVEHHRENRVGRIDPQTNTATTLHAPVHCALATGFGSVWAAEFSSNSVTRIDGRTGEVEATITVPDACGITVDRDAVWISSPAQGDLIRIDPRTNRVVDRIPVGPLIFGATPYGGRLWVSGEDRGGTLYLVDPRTGTVDIERRLEGAERILFAHGWAWVNGRAANAVYRVHPDTADVVTKTDVAVPAGIAASGDGIWVTGFASHVVTRLDTEGNVVAETEVPAINMGPPLVAFGSMWVADLTTNTVLRFDLEQLTSAT